MKTIIRLLVIASVLCSSTALAQNNEVTQGQPGRKGPWPVTSVQTPFTASTFEEVLVDVAATAFPKPTGTVSTVIKNLGPNPIYCGFDSGTLGVGNGLKVATGEAARFDTTQTLYCITTVKQVALAATRYMTLNTSGAVQLFGGGGGSSTSTDYTPGVPTNLSLSANVSGAVTGLAAGSCYQFSCNADFQYRTGTGTPTAVATDSEGKASVMYRQCLTNAASHTAFAFISSSAATCKVALIPAS
ncbi:MAG: hypothetical protein WC729_29295 [Sphingomonas sp.]|jgi:hypothetical protein|uniref:hypothetical protein n=1 Tax=Sphingomonas sp. TaxID=28214 RepID=UPI00356AEE67